MESLINPTGLNGFAHIQIEKFPIIMRVNWKVKKCCNL